MSADVGNAVRVCDVLEEELLSTVAIAVFTPAVVRCGSFVDC
jgi:hypothetical protein